MHPPAHPPHCRAVDSGGNGTISATELFQLAFVGVGDEPTFRKVALEMGFPKGSIAVESNATAQSIRALFRMVSQSTLRHSRRTVGTTGGFFGP
jgi:hypothetical protein